MANINIDRRIDDPFHRYTMPKLIVQNQGSKSILVNLDDIGHALHRSPSYIAKFFSYEFGVPIRMDTKTNVYLMSGSQKRDILQNALDKFIEYFVLCSKCNNPETELILRKRKIDELRKVCAACGYENSDNMASQRLTTFIVKDLRDTTKVKKTTNVIFKERPELLYTTDADDDDLDDNVSQCRSLTNLIEKKKNENKLTDLDTINEIMTNAEQSNVMGKIPYIIARCLFTANILKEIEEYKLLFQHLCKNNHKGQQYLLYAFEVLINEQKNIRREIFHTKVILDIFDQLHTYQIIDEETFIHWYENSSKYPSNKTASKKIRQMASEFIQRLNQSDDQNSDNDHSPSKIALTNDDTIK